MLASTSFFSFHHPLSPINFTSWVSLLFALSFLSSLLQPYSLLPNPYNLSKWYQRTIWLLIPQPNFLSSLRRETLFSSFLNYACLLPNKTARHSALHVWWMKNKWKPCEMITDNQQFQHSGICFTHFTPLESDDSALLTIYYSNVKSIRI